MCGIRVFVFIWVSASYVRKGSADTRGTKAARVEMIGVKNIRSIHLSLRRKAAF